jgi:hypothetical protein
LDGIHRAAPHGASPHYRKWVEVFGRELANGGLNIEPAKARLLESRRELRG